MNEFINNENRARLRDSINKPTDRTAGGGPIGATSPNEMPPGILGAPMTLDPHKNLRHAADNLEQKPGEVARSQRTAETRRRLTNPVDRYKY
jgi:hypothetical protein